MNSFHTLRTIICSTEEKREFNVSLKSKNKFFVYNVIFKNYILVYSVSRSNLILIIKHLLYSCLQINEQFISYLLYYG